MASRLPPLTEACLARAGKTFIAAVVMHNYYRWFPSSKLIFMAPTRPLVQQQVEAVQQVGRQTDEQAGRQARGAPPHPWLVPVVGWVGGWRGSLAGRWWASLSTTSPSSG